MTEFSIDVDPFNGVVNGVDESVADVDDAKVLVVNTADELLGATQDSDLTAAVQRIRDETLTVLAADSKTYINSAITAARQVRDTYLEFDATATTDANGSGG